MPLYEYACDACGRRFEIIQKFSETTEECRLCGKGPVHRLMSPPAIQFKGTGWYVTDYAQKGKSGDTAAGGEKPTGNAPAAAKSETTGASGTPAASPSSTAGSTAKD